MDMLRKSVTVIFAIFAFFTASIASAEPSKHHIVEIADGVYSFTTNGEYISMFAITDDGVIVFETVNTPSCKRHGGRDWDYH
nr:hypothetical protein [Enterovibrio nigricans]